jgi:AhpD family alkylhydroperoxidase
MRLDYASVLPAAPQALLGVEKVIASSSLEPTLLELVKVRASQINGCAFCVDMHTKDARAAGEEEHRLYLLVAWRECDTYSERERAALALAEAMTRLPDSHGVPDDVFGAAAELFSEQELAGLIWVVTVINGWNRIAITTGMEPGHYQPGGQE